MQVHSKIEKGPTKILIQHRDISLPAILSNYSSLIYPALPLDKFIKHNIRILHCSFLIRNEHILGLAVGTEFDNGQYNLFSFVIKEEDRNQGLGTYLMQSLIQSLESASSITKIYTHYKTFWANAPYWQKILNKTHWEPGISTLKYVVIENVQNLKQLSWVKGATLPDGFFLKSLDNNKLKKLCSWISEVSWADEIPKDVHPSKLLNQDTSESSVLLYHHHELCGWVLIEKIKDGQGQVPALYIRKKFRDSFDKLGIQFIAATINHNPKAAKAHFGFRIDHSFMESFVKEQLGDIATIHTNQKCYQTLN